MDANPARQGVAGQVGPFNDDDGPVCLANPDLLGWPAVQEFLRRDCLHPPAGAGRGHLGTEEQARDQ